jgi:hypothetical protein
VLLSCYAKSFTISPFQADEQADIYKLLTMRAPRHESGGVSFDACLEKKAINIKRRKIRK